MCNLFVLGKLETKGFHRLSTSFGLPRGFTSYFGYSSETIQFQKDNDELKGTTSSSACTGAEALRTALPCADTVPHRRFVRYRIRRKSTNKQQQK